MAIVIHIPKRFQGAAAMDYQIPPFDLSDVRYWASVYRAREACLAERRLAHLCLECGRALVADHCPDFECLSHYGPQTPASTGDPRR